VLALLALPRWLFGWQYGSRINTTDEARPRPVAIVFGAGLRRDGSPTTVLADRIRTAADLYHHGKVERLLMTGSVREGYDEPAAMAAAAEALGVPPSRILIDPAGLRTLDSCARARRVFGVRSALLVSQRFHLPRALALCSAVGVEADGVAADLSPYSSRARRFWELREYPASFVAAIEALLARPTGDDAA
jgi:SanA protein